MFYTHHNDHIVHSVAYFYRLGNYPKAVDQAHLIWEERGIKNAENYCRPACSYNIYDLSVSYARFPNDRMSTTNIIKQKVAEWNLSDHRTTQR